MLPYILKPNNGSSPYQEQFCRILRPDFSQNCDAILPHPMGDIKTNSLNMIFNNL